MKPLALLSGAIVCVAASVATALMSRPPAPPAPMLAVESPVHDFGTVGQGEELEASFELKNQSSHVLELAKPTTDCGCTLADLPKTRLEPGETTVLTGRLQTGSSRGLSARQITVPYKLADTKEGSALLLQLQAQIAPDFDVDPPRLQFKAEESGEQVVLFTAHQWADLKILASTSAHRALSTRLVNGEDSGRAEVAVSFDAAKWGDGDRGAEVTIETNSPHERVYHLRIDIGR